MKTRPTLATATAGKVDFAPSLVNAAPIHDCYEAGSDACLHGLRALVEVTFCNISRLIAPFGAAQALLKRATHARKRQSKGLFCVASILRISH